MNVLVGQPVGTVTLRAPTPGVVHRTAPAQLCGELEVYGAGETVAWVGDERLAAPGRGFIFRWGIPEGDLAETGSAIGEFRIA